MIRRQTCGRRCPETTGGRATVMPPAVHQGDYAGVGSYARCCIMKFKRNTRCIWKKTENYEVMQVMQQGAGDICKRGDRPLVSGVCNA